MGAAVDLLGTEAIAADAAPARNIGTTRSLDAQDETKSEVRRTNEKGDRWRTIKSIGLQIAVGILAGSGAVALRLALKLPLDVLPSFLVVIAVCLVTVAVGFLGGLITMIVGGILTWRYILNPAGSWALDDVDRYSLLGFFAVTCVILATSQLYRRSEARRNKVALELALQEAQHQRLFAREMSHRLKNAMAIVQAVASQTFTRNTPEVSKFEGRLSALANAHNLLNEHVKQPTASVTEVVATAIAAFEDCPDRFRVTGEPLPLPDQKVVSLSLALHELGTNAVKHGALSDPRGWVSIDWGASNGELHLEWKEHDGPAVVAPLSKGFGSRLLARAAMGTTMSFEHDGLRCSIKTTL